MTFSFINSEKWKKLGTLTISAQLIEFGRLLVTGPSHRQTVGFLPIAALCVPRLTV